MGVNKIILLGNLGKDPELRYTASQTPVCSFSLATGERRKDQSGNWTDHTEWHNVITFGKTAENCNNYLKKGRQVFIEGRIQTRKWEDKQGNTRYTTEVIANNVQFVGNRNGATVETSPVSDSPSKSDPAVFDSLKTAESLDSSAANEVSFDDDDIPF